MRDEEGSASKYSIRTVSPGAKVAERLYDSPSCSTPSTA